MSFLQYSPTLNSQHIYIGNLQILHTHLVWEICRNNHVIRGINTNPCNQINAKGAIRRWWLRNGLLCSVVYRYTVFCIIPCIVYIFFSFLCSRCLHLGGCGYDEQIEVRDLLSCDERRKFWVTWRDGLVQIGRGYHPNENKLLWLV